MVFIFDYVGNSVRYGLLDDEREWMLVDCEKCGGGNSEFILFIR